MAEKVTKLAFTTRIIVLVVQLISNVTFTDHNPDVFRTPTAKLNSTWLDDTVDFCFGGLRHWDGEYFLHIAEHSYTYENTLAFYPLYPLLVGCIARILHLTGIGLALRSWILLVAVSINVYLFCKTASLLYTFTLRTYKDPYKSWYTAMLFCFNPASIFFTAAYSEALFCFLTFSLMYECVSDLRISRLIFWLALSILTRSNGLLNIGFVVYFILRKNILRAYNLISTILRLSIVILSSLLPLSILYHYSFKLYCRTEDISSAHDPHIVNYAHARDYVLSGSRQVGNSPWCDANFPYPYSYVQLKYWNVGFLHYYELKQLPNFLLALPALSFLCYRCLSYLKQIFFVWHEDFTFKQRIKEYKSLPFVLHALFLTVFCTLFVHVQISTRLLCAATPCIYWFGSSYFNKPFEQIPFRSKPGIILCWFATYMLIGTILFSNNFPWT